MLQRTCLFDDGTSNTETLIYDTLAHFAAGLRGIERMTHSLWKGSASVLTPRPLQASQALFSLPSRLFLLLSTLLQVRRHCGFWHVLVRVTPGTDRSARPVGSAASSVPLRARRSYPYLRTVPQEDLLE